MFDQQVLQKLYDNQLSTLDLTGTATDLCFIILTQYR